MAANNMRLRRLYGLILLTIMKHIISFPASRAPVVYLSLSRPRSTVSLSGGLWHSCTFKMNLNMLLSGPQEQLKSVDLPKKRYFFTTGNKKTWKQRNKIRLYGSRSFNLKMGNNSTWASSRTTTPDARVIFASEMEAQRNRKRSVTNQITTSSKSKPSERDASKSYETFSTLPNQPGLQLDYDYLAQSSLSAIELLPHIKRNKGDWFLTKWWNAAKKWNLLTGRLQELGALQDERRQMKSVGNLTQSSLHAGSVNLTRFDRRKLNTAACEEDILKALHDLCQSHRARVIVIGDVHGCVDEVLDLLRKVQFMPGDLVLFLGDLVGKGPKSKTVIRFAMDIGAMSVRGNHDHEVLRQGISFSKKTGKYESAAERRFALMNKDEEHLSIALQLTVPEFEWLCQLPYYISSLDLGKLFVHAGFQNGVKLSEQHPWGMMTMRSLLSDGRISPRGVLKRPWASSWTGPQTVYFGHDAARGLQRHPNALGVDTGCVYGGNLTAILLPDEVIVSVPSKKVYRDYRKAGAKTSYQTLVEEIRGLELQGIEQLETEVEVELEEGVDSDRDDDESDKIMITSTDEAKMMEENPEIICSMQEM